MAWTYTTLKQAVKDYLETDQTDFNSYIDVAIRLTEEDICRKVQLPVFRKNATSAFTAADPYLALPNDFLTSFSLAVVNSGTHSYLVKKDESWIREAYPSSSTTGVPAHYALFDQDTILVGPTPTSSYTTELHYYHLPTSIVSASTSWLGTNAENAMLWGAVLHMAMFNMGSSDPTLGMLAPYKIAYDEAIEGLKGVGRMSLRDDFKMGTQ